MQDFHTGDSPESLVASATAGRDRSCENKDNITEVSMNSELAADTHVEG